MSWEVGHHMFLSVPRIASPYPHPFSIASLANTGSGSTGMDFLVRAADAFSKHFLACVATCFQA